MLEALITVIVVVAAVAVVGVLSAIRVIKQYERGVVLRLGRLRRELRGPGLTLIVPVIDRMRKVNMQIVTMPVPAQEGITRDNVTVRVDAVVYFKVVEPTDAVIQVMDYQFAVSQMAQTSLRSIIGKSDLDDLLSNREKLNQGLELMIDSPAVDWGVHVDRVEIKDVSLPDTMKRSMARQAEAHRERRARVINADAELQASRRLAEAAEEMAVQPAALQLRLLQTITAVAAEKNSTLVLPFPVELLRFLERAEPSSDDEEADASTPDGTVSKRTPQATNGAPEPGGGGHGGRPEAEEEVAPTFRPAAARKPRTGTPAEPAAPFAGPLPPDPAAARRDPAMTLPELQVTGLPTAEPPGDSPQEDPAHSGHDATGHDATGHDTTGHDANSRLGQGV